MDIYQQLKADHDRQRSLIHAVSQAGDDLEARHRLLCELYTELDAHAAAEEQTYYAALLKHSRDHERIRFSVADHDALAALVVELASPGLDDPEWAARFDELRDKLHRHLDTEETDGFTLARRLLDDDRARALGERYADLKAVELGVSIALATPLLPILDDFAGFGSLSLVEFRF
jgi:hypothetical protein